MAALDQEAPWTWRLDDVLGLLTDRQRRYVELLPRIFRLRTAAGKVVPYTMEPYQAWWHAHSPLALGRDAPSRIVEKGRGLGLTLMAAVDALMLAHRDEAITIPVAGRAGDTSDEFIEKTWHLLDDAIEPDFFDPRRDVRNRVELLHNGSPSKIVPMPGGSPEKVRSKRTVHGVLDEFAFHEYAERLWRAVRGSQSEGGTLDVLSTHNGADTLYYRLLEEAKTSRVAMKVFHYPICDPKAFRQDVPIKDQLAGGMRLIAPWLDPRVLDEFRREDPVGFAQEMLCEVMDAALNLVARAEVEAAMTSGLPDWGRMITAADGDLFTKFRSNVTLPVRPQENVEPCFLGIDFASAEGGDLAAYTVFQEDGANLDQRFLEVMQGVPTPTQNEYLRLVERTLRPTAVLIDMTGGGTGLFEHAKADLKCPVYGVHFSSTVHYAGATKATSIKKAMALNVARRYSEKSIRVFKDHPRAELQRRHVQSVRRSDLDAPRKEGHGDILWAQALAAWGAMTMQPARKADAPTDVGAYY